MGFSTGLNLTVSMTAVTTVCVKYADETVFVGKEERDFGIARDFTRKKGHLI